MAKEALAPKEEVMQEEIAEYAFPEKDAKTQHYQILVLSTQVETEEQATALSQEVKKEIEALSGSITKEEMWGNKSLAYSVNNTRNGFYFQMEFDMDTLHLVRLNEKLRIRKDVARFIIVKKRVVSSEEQAEQERVKAIIEKRRTAKMEKDLNAIEEVEEKAEKKTAEPKEEKKQTAPEKKAAVEQGIEKLLSDDLDV